MITRFFISLKIFILIVVITTVSPTLAKENLSAFIKKVGLSVVNIITYDVEWKPIREGTGFFINNEGEVITNRNVIEGGIYADVKTFDRKLYPVRKVLAEDKEANLIQISAEIPQSAVQPVPLNLSIPQVGERMIVIGHSSKFEKQVIRSMIVAVREIPIFGKIIQIRTKLPPNFNGSPVVNMKGEVIGIAIYQIGKIKNLKFVVPIKKVVQLVSSKDKTLLQWEVEKEEAAEEVYSNGLPYLWKEEYEKALPYFEETVKKDANYASAYFQTGYCNAELGRYKKAIVAYKQAIRIEPEFVLAHYWVWPI
jgi:S1-C subfamily serine protease